MSSNITVFVSKRSLLPSPEAWSTAASAIGFDLKVEPPFDPLHHKGGLPVVCSGIEASFGYFCETVVGYLREAAGDFSWLECLRLLRFRYAVDFVTHSRQDDRFAAVVAAAAFAVAADGLLLDGSTGKLMTSQEAAEWARTRAVRPSDALIAARRETVSVIHAWVGPILASLGYIALPKAPSPRARADDRWFSRNGTAFRHELIEVSVYADGEESFLGITFHGTPFPLETLAERGFFGSAAGWYLSVVADVLGWPEDSVLPQNIPVDPHFPETATAERLRRELVQADAVVFARLRQSLETDGEWWPDAS